MRLRFQEQLPIRAIAERWGEDAARLHREYARARKEFREALREAVRFHEVAPAGGVDAECDRLLEFLR